MAPSTTRADREVARVLVSVRHAITRHRLFRSGQHVLVGCSGGSDSVALTRILARLRGELGISLEVVGVDHGLRAEASLELDAVAALADSLGLPFTCAKVVVTPDGRGLQAAAREARYDALRRHAAHRGAARIAVGHTLDDQAETVLSAVVRGKSLHALRGIAWRRGDGVVRPLLGVRRATLRAWLDAGGHPYVDDPSNVNPRFERARIRAAWPVLEQLDPRVVEHLAHLAEESRAASAALRRRGRAWRARAELDGTLRLSVLRAASTGTRREVLRVWAAERGWVLGRAAHELEAAIEAGRGEVWVGSEVTIRVEAGRVVGLARTSGAPGGENEDPSS
ncbi:MAG: tRNA lysidine(34) synthetase TilS [Sandaracinus sp.]|nr:tRNA lysidine(34) synthetase TilS [Sandaracinus sp.]MCB9624822.1 tRNA lysidine(34) synthetase TilS [Sandaracinus sp.]